MATTMTASSYG